MDPPRIATAADGVTLEKLADALAEYDELRATLAREGRTYTTTTPAGSAMIRPRPEAAMAADAWRRAVNLARDFALTPSSRPKVSAAPAPAAGSPWPNLVLDVPPRRPRRPARPGLGGFDA